MANVIQIPSNDGCIYLYNLDTGKAQKICDLVSPKDYPDDVKEKIAKLQRSTV
ncbi:MAG: hypothetical protein Ta2A_11120 [Treponemataceae bacterium]|nr:MAG: hypothetical protein Ta2A_11120 [Treponemataceae bacterium]